MTAVTAGAVRPQHSSGTPAHTFWALLARDFRVIRRDIVTILIRMIAQPVLFTFVFAFVMPKIGSSGTGSPFASASSHGIHFSTILVPGMVATALLLQGLFAVTAPLVLELSYTREIEDRALAPVRVWVLGLEKVAAGAMQALFAALIIFPLVLLIHAPGQAPSIDFHRWWLLVPVLLLAPVWTSALSLLVGTLVDPRKLSMMFGVVVVPLTMLGCVYYPWVALHSVPWLQVVTLFNPLVYISEALRAALTPEVPHMRPWILLTVIGVGALLATVTSVWTFKRRLTT